MRQFIILYFYADGTTEEQTFWFKRDSHFRLFDLTVFIADSVCFAIPAISHLSGLWLPEGHASHDLHPALYGALLRCLGRCFIQARRFTR